MPKAPSGPIGPSGRDHLPYLTVRGGIQPERAVVSADVSRESDGDRGVTTAAGARSGLAVGYLAGLLLVAWIAVQLLILRRYFFLQPIIAGIGAAEVLLAWRWQRSGRIVTRARDQRP